MKWTEEAEKAISRVPFFVRKRVKKKVEESAKKAGATEVTLQHVRLLQKKYMQGMEKEIKGYEVETCFGPGGCPNRAVEDSNLAEKIESILQKHQLKEFLKERVKGSLKFHHQFRVSISDCPNACSRPQIVDVGIIGAKRPVLTDETCSNCMECMDICIEKAVSVDLDDGPMIDYSKCVLCGKCISVCPTGAISEGETGYRLLLGGKLGRHPQLGRELERIYKVEEVPAIIESIINFYKAHCEEGERLGEIINRISWEKSIEKIKKL